MSYFFQMNYLSTNYTNHRRHKLVIVSYTTIHTCIYLVIITLHFLANPASLLSIVLTIRYELYMVVFCAECLAVLWLVWIRFTKLGTVFR